MTDRAPFIRPSSLPALEICAGRADMEARACALVPGLADWSSPIAMQGTMGHAVIAQTLALIYHSPERLGPDAALAKMAGAIERLEPWTRDAVRRCVVYAIALIDQHRKAGADVVVQIEMHLSGKGVNIGRGGTADLVLLVRDPLTKAVLRVIVVDWKLGFLDQGEAADHLQLAAYTVMAWDKYQPRDGAEVHLGQGRRKDFTAASYTAADIAGARERCKAVVNRANAERPELWSHIDACRYCKALCLCKRARAGIRLNIEEAQMFGIEATSPAVALAARFADAAKELAGFFRNQPDETASTDPLLFGTTSEDRARLAEDAAAARTMVKQVRGAA